MDFCITPEELRKALIEIEVAEKNGFKFCLSVFKLVQCGYGLDECRAIYSDILEKAHPTSSRLNWGRFQGVTKRHKFKNGKLIKLTDKLKSGKAGVKKRQGFA